MNYPKVLIIGEYFHLKSGGGITLSNLFTGWEKSNIAVVSERIIDPDWSVCNKFYQLGYKENKRKFPFYLWEKKFTSGPIEQRKEAIYDNEYRNVKYRNIRSKGKLLYNSVLNFFGLNFYLRRIKLSSELKNWIEEFSPEIVYTQLSQWDLIEFIIFFKKKYDLPLVVHIMDDWPTTIADSGIFKHYWRKKIDGAFKNILSNASALFSIGEAMSEEYYKRYGYNFIPFHNPIETKQWLAQSKTDYSFKEPFTLLYAGRIGTGISDCLLDLANAINFVRGKQFLNIEFHIQTTSVHNILDELVKFNFVSIRNKASYAELPSIFSNADALIIANNFDRSGIDFLKYSMPTKASEYMVSGTPILVYASGEVGITKHAIKNKWALVVNERSTSKLADAINKLYQEQELRTSLGITAKEYALKNYDAEIVRNLFFDALSKVVKKYEKIDKI